MSDFQSLDRVIAARLASYRWLRMPSDFFNVSNTRSAQNSKVCSRAKQHVKKQVNPTDGIVKTGKQKEQDNGKRCFLFITAFMNIHVHVCHYIIRVDCEWSINIMPKRYITDGVGTIQYQPTLCRLRESRERTQCETFCRADIDQKWNVSVDFLLRSIRDPQPHPPIFLQKNGDFYTSRSL